MMIHKRKRGFSEIMCFHVYGQEKKIKRGCKSNAKQIEQMRKRERKREKRWNQSSWNERARAFGHRISVANIM